MLLWQRAQRSAVSVVHNAVGAVRGALNALRAARGALNALGAPACSTLALGIIIGGGFHSGTPSTLAGQPAGAVNHRSFGVGASMSFASEGIGGIPESPPGMTALTAPPTALTAPTVASPTALTAPTVASPTEVAISFAPLIMPEMKPFLRSVLPRDCAWMRLAASDRAAASASAFF